MHFILLLFLILIHLTSEIQSNEKLNLKRIGKESYNPDTIHLVRKRSIFGQQITNQDKLLLTAYTVVKNKIMIQCKLKRPWSRGIMAVRWMQMSIVPTENAYKRLIVRKYLSGKTVLNRLYENQGIRIQTYFSNPELAEMKMVMHGSATSRLGNKFYCSMRTVLPGLENKVTIVGAKMVIKGSVPKQGKTKGKGKLKQKKKKVTHENATDSLESKKKKDSKRIMIASITISGLAVIFLIQIYCIYCLRGRIKKLKIEKIYLSQMNLADDFERYRQSDTYVSQADGELPPFPEDIYPKSKISLQQYKSNQMVHQTHPQSKTRQNSNISRLRSSRHLPSTLPEEKVQHSSGSKLKQKMSRTRSIPRSESIPLEILEEQNDGIPLPKTSRTQSLHQSASGEQCEYLSFEKEQSQYKMSPQRHTSICSQRHSSKSSHRPASDNQQIVVPRHSSQTSKYIGETIRSSHEQLSPYPPRIPSYAPNEPPVALDVHKNLHQPSPSWQQQQQSITQWSPSRSGAQTQEMPSVHTFLPQDASTPGPHLNQDLASQVQISPQARSLQNASMSGSYMGPVLTSQIHELQKSVSPQARSLQNASMSGSYLGPVLTSQIHELQKSVSPQARSLQNASISGSQLYQIHQLQKTASSQVRPMGHLPSQMETPPSMASSFQTQGTEMAAPLQAPSGIAHLQSKSSHQSVGLPPPSNLQSAVSFQTMYASSPQIEALPPPPAPPIIPDQVQSQVTSDIYETMRSDDLLDVISRRRQQICPDSRLNFETSNFSVYGQSNAALAEMSPPHPMPPLIEQEVPRSPPLGAEPDRNALLNSINARQSSTQFSTHSLPPMPPAPMFVDVELNRNTLPSSIEENQGSSTQQFAVPPSPFEDVDPGRNALLSSINARYESSSQQFSAPQVPPAPVEDINPGRNALLDSINARHESSTQHFAPQVPPAPVGDIDPGRNAMLYSINAGRQSSTQQFSGPQVPPAPVGDMDPGRNALLNSINARSESSTQHFAPQVPPAPVGDIDPGRNAMLYSINAGRQSSTQQFSGPQVPPAPVEDMDPGRNALLNSINARSESSTQHFAPQVPPAPVGDMDPGRNALLNSINARRGSSLPDIPAPLDQSMSVPPPASDPGRGALLSSIAARRRSSTSSSIMPN